MNAKHLRNTLALSLLLAGSAHAGLPAGLSGPWFNPEQSGHGLTLELLDNGGALLFWHVYDPDGNPLTLYIEGTVEGRRIDGIAYAPRGMRFGEFDPDTLQLPVWGQVSVEFDDCNRATLRWNADAPAYADGEMTIARLASLAGLDCTLPADIALPVGLYRGEVIVGFAPADVATGVVDPQGRLWGIERTIESDLNGASAPYIPGPAWVGGYAPHMVRIDTVDPDGAARGALAPLLWATLATTAAAEVTGDWVVSPDGAAVGQFEALRANDSTIRQTWTNGVADVSLIAPIDIAAVAGSYTIWLRDQFFLTPHTLTIAGDGMVCIDLGIGGSERPCVLSGSVWTPDGAAGLFDFELQDHRLPVQPRYIGRGWLERRDGETELVMVGDNGGVGFGLFGR